MGTTLKMCAYTEVIKTRLISVHAQLLSCVQLFATPWTIDGQAPLYMGLSRQEYWSGLLFPLPEDLPDLHAAAAAKLLQSRPTLCDPIDGSPPDSPIPGIL